MNIKLNAPVWSVLTGAHFHHTHFSYLGRMKSELEDVKQKLREAKRVNQGRDAQQSCVAGFYNKIW